jgi:hypothetical protein
VVQALLHQAGNLLADPSAVFRLEQYVMSTADAKDARPRKPMTAMRGRHCDKDMVAALLLICDFYSKVSVNCHLLCV